MLDKMIINNPQVLAEPGISRLNIKELKGGKTR